MDWVSDRLASVSGSGEASVQERVVLWRNGVGRDKAAAFVGEGKASRGAQLHEDCA